MNPFSRKHTFTKICTYLLKPEKLTCFQSIENLEKSGGLIDEALRDPVSWILFGIEQDIFFSENTGCLRTMWTQLWANILLNLWQILPIYVFVFKLWSLPGHLNPIFSNLVQYFWFYEVLKKFGENWLSPKILHFFAVFCCRKCFKLISR